MKTQSKDSLGDRMKRYEAVSKTTLVQRMPVILRLDGCHFHTFTKGFVKPFDDVMIKSMQNTMKYLCENIQNCVFGYTQSDEITLVLVDYKNLNSSQWFDNEVQKMCSVAASMAAFLLSSGKKGKRYALKNSEIMIHQPLGGASGQATEIKIAAERIIRIKNKMNKILSKNTSKKIEDIENDTERDYFMTSDEALSYGIIDKIL